MTEYPRQELIAWLKREARSCSALYKNQIEAVAAMLEADADVRVERDRLRDAFRDLVERRD